MNYLKIYYDIINLSKLRGLNKKKLDYYTEKHHIIPAYMFKSRKIASYNENLILLTAREHFICHYLLFKHFKDSKSFFAFNNMCHGNKNHKRYKKLSSKQYEILRNENAKFSSDLSKNNKNFLNKKHSEHSKSLISKSLLNNKRSFSMNDEWKLKISKSKLGKSIKPHSEKQKQRMILNNAKSKPVIVNNVKFYSKRQATIKLNMTWSNIVKLNTIVYVDDAPNLLLG